MRVSAFSGIARNWIHPVEVKTKGEKTWRFVLAARRGWRSFYAPRPDSYFIGAARQVGSFVQTATSFEKVSLKQRAKAGRPFVYDSELEALEALARLLTAGAALHVACSDEGNQGELVRRFADRVHVQLCEESALYSTLQVDRIAMLFSR
jgi:hypothetical protein